MALKKFFAHEGPSREDLFLSLQFRKTVSWGNNNPDRPDAHHRHQQFFFPVEFRGSVWENHKRVSEQSIYRVQVTDLIHSPWDDYHVTLENVFIIMAEVLEADGFRTNRKSPPILVGRYNSGGGRSGEFRELAFEEYVLSLRGFLRQVLPIEASWEMTRGRIAPVDFGKSLPGCTCHHSSGNPKACLKGVLIPKSVQSRYPRVNQGRKISYHYFNPFCPLLPNLEGVQIFDFNEHESEKRHPLADVRRVEEGDRYVIFSQPLDWIGGAWRVRPFPFSKR